MSKELATLKKDIATIKGISEKMSDTEKKFLLANQRFKNLTKSTQSKYLKIYTEYTTNDITETQLSERMEVSLSVVRNVINLFGERLVLFSKGMNVLAPMLDKVRHKKEKLQADIDNLTFKKMEKGDIKTHELNIKVADLRIKYLTLMHKLDEQEIRMRGLLENAININVDKSQQNHLHTGYEKPKSNVKTINEKVIDVESNKIDELPEQ